MSYRLKAAKQEMEHAPVFCRLRDDTVITNNNDFVSRGSVDVFLG